MISREFPQENALHFLFLYPSPGVLGGIETQMVRMSNWLISRGHRVTVMTLHDDKWKSSMPEGVRCIALGERLWDLVDYGPAKRLWQSLNLPKVDVIKSFSWGELKTIWIGYQLSVISGARIVTGVYGPRKMMKDHFHPDFYLRSYLRDIPNEARVFMSPEQIEDMEERYNSSGVLWPLPVDSTQFVPAVRRPIPGRIVSIGRLDHMKEYNLYMPAVVDELIRRGHPVTWTVYGVGPYETEMRAAIRARNLEGAITIAGAMPYSQCRQVLAEAWVFIGMGTTVLEASLFAVPNVLAVAYDTERLTYGPIYRVPIGSVGDVLSAPPTLNVVDELERVLRLSPSEYAAEAERVREYAQPYESDISMQRFLEIVKAAPHRPRRWPLFAHYLEFHFWPSLQAKILDGRKRAGRARRKLMKLLTG